MSFSGQYENKVSQDLDLNSYLISHPLATYFLKMTGNALLNSGIHSGDILIVDRSVSAQNGKISVVEYGGELLVRHIYQSHGRVILKASPPEFSDIITTGQDLVLWGTVTGILRKY